MARGKLQSAGVNVTGNRDEVLCTVLGSCVAVCLCDSERGAWGMNHFMLPEAAPGDPETARLAASAVPWSVS